VLLPLLPWQEPVALGYLFNIRNLVAPVAAPTGTVTLTLAEDP